ncbi:MAG TPA: SDR family NAD(P)-dependent oxidoreductase [Bacteriovoracaceae bacterium]|nr:SDR family NAD(P)-dependent oxidoreductase [Bacteriovoracaceae bacterium]
MSSWTASYIDSLAGKTFVVTRGTSGIGLETVKELLRHDAFVIMGASEEKKGKKVLEDLKREFPDGKLMCEHLDLGSLSSIYGFVDRIMHDHPSVDVLINNACTKATPKRLETTDGHELVFSINYLGHFVLTSQLFPLLLRSRDPRVVSVSSLRHHSGKLNFENLEFHKGYEPDVVYSQSKLAILMFALELHRRCHVSGNNVRSIPVHPGALESEIFDAGPLSLVQRILIKSLGQNAHKGALPILFGATSLEARSGIYYGPDGVNEYWGNPIEAKVAVHADNMIASARLWEESEKLAGVRFDVSGSKTIGLH